MGTFDGWFVLGTVVGDIVVGFNDGIALG